MARGNGGWGIVVQLQGLCGPGTMTRWICGVMVGCLARVLAKFVNRAVVRG